MTEAVRQGGDEFSGAALTTVAASLRWSRPDLTAALAGHAADVTPDGDPVWLLATGWRVHGVAATGDSRSVLAEVLGEVGSSAVDLASTDGLRLVVEVAGACQDNGDTGMARRLAERVVAGAAGSAELRLDARLVLIRCAVAVPESRLDPADLLDLARADAAALPGPGPSAAVELAAATVARSSGRLREAVEAAEAGLRLLGGIGVSPSAPPLADALAAQRIGGLVELGRTTEAREAARQAVASPRASGSSRQAAQLRLAIAQATADDAEAAGRALTEAAEHAAAVDVPGLEAACRTASAGVAERIGALDVALREIRAGMAAEQRDKERGRRHRELVAGFAERLGAPVARGPVGSGRSSAGATRLEQTPSDPSLDGVAVQGASDVPTAAPGSAGAGAGALSAIDALLGSFDTAADALGGAPLARPVPARRVGPPVSPDEVSETRAPADGASADLGSGNAAGARGPERPRRERRRTVATAVPIEVDGGSATPASYGALLGDALISELRASGRWSDDGAGAWPRLDRDRDSVIDRTDSLGLGSGASAEAEHGLPESGRALGGRRRRETSSASETRTEGLGRADERQANDLTDRGVAAGDHATGRRAAGGRTAGDGTAGEQPVSGSSGGVPGARDLEVGDLDGDLSASAGRAPAPSVGEDRTADGRSAGHREGSGGGRGVGGHRESGVDGREDAAARTAAPAPQGRAARRRAAEEAALEQPVSPAAPAESSEAAATESADEWLRSTLADLDRMWGGAAGEAPAAEVPDRGAAQDVADGDRAAVGASVVIDLVQGVERLHTRQAERVMRDLTDRMRVHLPRRGRIRDEDPATLQVDLPGRDRAECAAWMHPVIRDLATAVAGAMALDPIGMSGVTEFRLRGTVYGTDGRPGVQLIQEIPEPGSEPARSGDALTKDLAGRAGGRRRRRAVDFAEDDEDSDPAAAVAPDDLEVTGAERSRTGSAASHWAAPRSGETRSDGTRSDGTRSDGTRSDGTGSDGTGSDGTGSDGTGSGARRSNRMRSSRAASSSGGSDGAEAEEAGSGEGPASGPDTPEEEKLGLGDLLAGAMAAYRGL